MSQTYTVKPGDTLLQIAIDHDVEFPDLLEANPQFQTNPNLIYPNDIVTLSESVDFESIQPSYDIEPVSELRPTACEGKITSSTQCAPIEVEELLFFTGSKPEEYLCLDAQSYELLMQEVAVTDELINRYRTIISEAPAGENVTEAAIAEHALKRQAWVEDAIYAGAIAPKKESKFKVAGSGGSQTNVDEQSENEKQRKAQIAALKNRIQFVENYDESYWIDDSSVEDVREMLLKPLKIELANLESLTPQKPKTQMPKTWPVAAKKLSDKTKTVVKIPATRHIVEVWSMRNNGYLYLRAEFVTRERKVWKPSENVTELQKALKSKNKGEIVEALKKDLDANPKTLLSPALNLSIADWNLDGGVWQEWSGQKHWLNDDGNTLFAVSAEAQLMRWGAQAAVATTFEPMDGKIDIGISADAKISLAEASAKFSRYLPHDKGFGLSLTYRDVNGQLATHSFGRLRGLFEVTVGAFVGAYGKVGAKAEAQFKKKSDSTENENTGTGILLSPRISMLSGSRVTAGIGVSAEGFAGAEAGGEFKGGIDWCDPKDEAELNFGTLGSVGGKGTIAFGAGYGADFQYTLDGGRFYFHCASRVVWGAGASGGFATEVDLNKVWDMAQVIWRGLQVVDYRRLENLNGPLYEYLVRASYLAFASTSISNPKQALINAVSIGEDRINIWWQTRTSKIQEATTLANRLRHREYDVWSGVPKNQLLPETIGIMLDTLVEAYWGEPTEDQEEAICILLRESTHNWSKFREVLTRMNSNGKKDGSSQSDEKLAFTSLKRINDILDGRQQDEFNAWVHNLALKNTTDNKYPFNPVSGAKFVAKINSRRELMLARNSKASINNTVV
jgi:LysM repeat protein